MKVFIKGNLWCSVKYLLICFREISPNETYRELLRVFLLENNNN